MSIDDWQSSLSYHAERVWYQIRAAGDFPAGSRDAFFFGGASDNRCINANVHNHVISLLLSGFVCCSPQLSDELDNTAGLLDLALGVLAEVTCADDERDLRDASLSEDLAVAEREEVEDWGSVGGLVGEVLLALLNRDESPELV